MTTIDKLPLELLLEISRLLPEKDACRLMVTCTFYYAALQEELYRRNIRCSNSTLLPSVIGAGRDKTIDLAFDILAEFKPALKVSSRDRFGRTALVESIQADNASIALRMIRRYPAQINMKCLSSGWRPLTLAVGRNQVNVVKALLEKKQIDVNCSSDIKGRGSPLHLACKLGRYRLVEMLLTSNSIDSNAVDKNLRSALDLAVQSGCSRTVQVVLENGHNLDPIEMHGHNPIFEAIMSGNVQILEMMIQHKVPVVAPQLGKALQLGNEPVVWALLSAGINLASAQWMSYTALSCAAQGGIIYFVRRLLPSASLRERRDALLCASKSRHWAVANLIMDEDAKSMSGSIFSKFPLLPWYLLRARWQQRHEAESHGLDFKIYESQLLRRQFYSTNRPQHGQSQI